MSLIEMALQKAQSSLGAKDVNQRRNPPVPSRRMPTAAATTEPATGTFTVVTPDRAVMEANCVLSEVEDQAVLRSYKILRTRVLQRLTANNWHSTAITAAGSGEGKSLTAINLSLALAQDVNTRVVLVDLDLQRPHIAQYLGISHPKGVADYLAGEATLDEIACEIKGERLIVLPGSQPLVNSSELLASPRMRALSTELSQRFPNWVIVFDMPPLMASDDMLVFAPQVDSVLLVVSESVSQRQVMLRAKETLAEMNLLGVMLNRSRERNDSLYY